MFKQKIKYFSENFPRKFSDYFIDKSLKFYDRTEIISEFLENNQNELILKPDSFGKTFNLNIIKYFLSNSNNVDGSVKKDQRYKFFENKLVFNNKKLYDENFALHPIIYLNFNEMDLNKFDDNIYKLQYISHVELEENIDKEILSNLNPINSGSLENITINYINEITRKIAVSKGNPILLIDSYDTPLINSFKHGFYNEMINFMQNLFKSLFVHNKYIKKTLITGVNKIENDLLFPFNINIREERKYDKYFGYVKTDEITNSQYIKFKIEESNLDKIMFEGIKTVNSISYIKMLAQLKKNIDDLKNQTHIKFIISDINLKKFDHNIILNYLYYNGLINEDGLITNEIASNIINYSIPEMENLKLNQKLAFVYYRYFHYKQYNQFFNNLKEILENTGKTKEDVINFRTEKDFETFIIDLLTLEMNNRDPDENVEIYSVDDNELLKVSNELKKFTLITYEKSKVAIFVKGNKYKLNKKDADVDIENVNELYNNPNIDNIKKNPFKKLNKKTIENNLRKLNDECINSINKNEALEFLIKLSGDYDDVYFISFSNYQKFIEYSMDHTKTKKE